MQLKYKLITLFQICSRWSLFFNHEFPRGCLFNRDWSYPYRKADSPFSCKTYRVNRRMSNGGARYILFMCEFNKLKFSKCGIQLPGNFFRIRFIGSESARKISDQVDSTVFKKYGTINYIWKSTFHEKS